MWEIALSGEGQKTSQTTLGHGISYDHHSNKRWPRNFFSKVKVHLRDGAKQNTGIS